MIVRKSWIAIICLYGIQLAIVLALAMTANQQGLITKEEASSAFVNPVFLEARLQHHVFGTNFYAYVFLDAASRVQRDLFYGRVAKAIIMAFLPCVVYLYLRARFALTTFEAFAGALVISTLPGVLCFSWLGVDFGMEAPLGFLALTLALSDDRWRVIAGGAAAALAAGCYGSGIVFLPVVLIHQIPRLKNPRLRSAVLTNFALMIAILLFPVFWWTNIQTLWMGGGRPTLSGAIDRLASLAAELFWRGDSYYFFSGGRPALGDLAIGLAAVAGLVLFTARHCHRSWPLLAVSASTIAMYAIAGNVIGVRRAIPLTVSLGIFSILCIRELTASRRAFVAGVLAIFLAINLVSFSGIRRELALPRDFEFAIPAGNTMASTVAGLLNGSISLPQDLNGYEPDRTLAILYLLSKPHPLYSLQTVVAACDRHGWSIPSTSPRFERFRKQP